MGFRWGIISTGAIATAFVKDLLIDPKTRGVTDVVHKVVAVGSRSVEKAQGFIDKVIGRDTGKAIKAYGTYEDVYADERVEAVYIGTPHTCHYKNALDAMKARKHVLCEKPATCNAPQLRALLSVAAEHGVFFMEAMWTRFQPLLLEVKTVIESGDLGAPVVVLADLSRNFGIEELPKTHRILDPELGGGALLDLGPYPLVWAITALYENPLNKSVKPTKITASMLKTRITGVDTHTSFTLTFSHLDAQAILSCSITVPPLDPGVTIRFRNGAIVIPPPIYCPKSYTIQYFGLDGGKREEKKAFSYIGRGWHFQADEVARCVGLGQKESDLWGHDKCLLEMEIFDEVRRQGGLKYPDGVESLL